MKPWRWPLLLLAAFGLSSQAHERDPWPPPLLPAVQQADAIHVYKAQRRMDLLRDGRVLAT